jgi:hypothetical protein
MKIRKRKTGLKIKKFSPSLPSEKSAFMEGIIDKNSKEWQEAKINEMPGEGGKAGEGPKPEIKESDESKEVDPKKFEVDHKEFETGEKKRKKKKKRDRKRE